jgi:hypothetical protein
MARCPHCGEPVSAGQERCFACGQKVRSRGRQHRAPVNGLLIAGAAGLFVIAIVGFIIIQSGAKSRSAKEREQAELARVQDSVRAANRAARDTSRTANRDDLAAGLAEELARIEQRFNRTRAEVVKGQPSSAQQRIISDFNNEFGRLRGVSMALSGATPAKRDSLSALLRDGQRRLRTLVSDLARAPKK